MASLDTAFESERHRSTGVNLLPTVPLGIDSATLGNTLWRLEPVRSVCERASAELTVNDNEHWDGHSTEKRVSGGTVQQEKTGSKGQIIPGEYHHLVDSRV